MTEEQEVYETDRAICGTCGHELTLVRPGKHQCDWCELAEELERTRDYAVERDKERIRAIAEKDDWKSRVLGLQALVEQLEAENASWAGVTAELRNAATPGVADIEAVYQQPCQHVWRLLDVRNWRAGFYCQSCLAFEWKNLSQE
ncbi:MAG: hypothetical protein HYY29_03605 [Chloroflexi bacterium]|nr:hypothetical protein [Chloroflexota bacterium]